MSVFKSIEDAYDTIEKYIPWKNSFKEIQHTMSLYKESYHHQKQIRNVIFRSITQTLSEEDIW